MQGTGDASVVVQGKLSPDAWVASSHVTLPGGFVATLRESEIVGPELRPDLELDAGLPEAKVLEAAARLALHPTPARAARTPKAAPPSAFWAPDATYADAPYPSREARILSLFRFWNVIHDFYPYLPLMGDAWDRALEEFLPRFESAASAHEYVLTVAELAARIPDGHVNVWGSRELADIQGGGVAPFAVQVVEGHVVVTAVPDPAALGGATVSVGDVIVSVDGEPIDARMARLRKYCAASNETWRAYRTAGTALRGALDAKLQLVLQDATGRPREASVPRTTKFLPERSGPVFRLVDDSIGYVDLDRLENSDVDAMFKAFAGTKAIVFDMRGYPHGTAWTVAPRLNVRGAKVAARFFEPFVSVGSSQATFFEQGIPPTDQPLYRGKTVMLVDERTMSQAEHTGLFFEAAAGTTFIGSQTAGANGDVTNLSLPGGLSVSFSGHDVRHADGRQLQRVGLVPDVEVHPTIDGLHAGRDEVLERALTYLRTGR
jgi:C-terminal processing protease CtpA/Prc